MYMVADQATLEATRNELAANAQNLLAAITRLRGAAQGGMAKWQSDARVSFEQSLETLNQAVDHVGRVVDQLGVAVQTHARNVQAVQDAGVAMFRLG